MKVYAVSDLHGMYDLYKQIKEFIQPDDIVYCLGDCGDRGPDSWATIKAVYDDPHFTYLKGNHEDMLIKAMRDNLKDEMHGFGHNLSVLSSNGGRKTFDSWREESLDDKKEWFTRLLKLPTTAEYVNASGKKILMSHAGYNPGYEECWRDYIWDREHIYDPWDGTEDEIILHGHTPFVYMSDAYEIEDPQAEEMPGDKPIHACWYAGHHKCCIDAGAFFTQQTILLDLDTFEEHYFSVKE